MAAFRDFVINDGLPDSPCNGCGERAAGCHAGCRRYRLFRRIRAAHARKTTVERALDEGDARRARRVTAGSWDHPKKGGK